MRFRDYFFGVPVKLRSRLEPIDVAQRINEAAGSILLPWTEGVAGGVRFGLVRLRFQRSIFEFNMKPVLAGRVQSNGPGSLLLLSYRAPFAAHIFLLIWYGVLSLIFLAALAPSRGESPGFHGALISLILFAVPIATVYGGTRRSDEDLTDLLEFLAEKAEARTMPL
jgi:hypothetical protein